MERVRHIKRANGLSVLIAFIALLFLSGLAFSDGAPVVKGRLALSQRTYHHARLISAPPTSSSRRHHAVVSDSIQHKAINQPLIKLMGARLSQKGLKTQLVFEFNKPFRYRMFMIRHPNRLVLDLQGATLATDLRELSLSHTVITSIRHAEHGHNSLRMVFDLKQYAKIRGMVLKPKDQYGDRLLLSLTQRRPIKPKSILKQKQHTQFIQKKISVNKKLAVAQTTSKTSMKSIRSINKATDFQSRQKKAGKGKIEISHKALKEKPKQKPKQKPKKKPRNIIIVIDPGHGGKDPGATGPGRSHEKNVVLAISKYLKRELNRTHGLKAVLTRKGDYYLTLRDRLRIARKDHADFFVAIHADAYPKRSAEGASVFALSRRGATSEAARWLAEKENYSELGGVFLANKSRLVRSLLLDLSQTATITESIHIGASVIHFLKPMTRLHSRHVEQARFVVLKSPDILSLLVETGFITNPSEERRLNNPHYQQRLAKAIAEGIKTFFWRNPPPNTVFNFEKNVKKHVVTKGDSLSAIAVRYHVSVVSIKQLNDLLRNSLRVGQVLRIPPAL